MASPRGGAAPLDPRSVPTTDKKSDWKQALEALEHTLSLQKVQSSNFEAIFLPGGHGTMFDLPKNEHLKEILGKLHASQKIIASVCHGPAGLVSAIQADGTPLVSGKTVVALQMKKNG